MFVINPDPYSTPSYRIGPFRTSDLVLNNCLPQRDTIDNYFRSRFTGRDYIYTENGRQAINIALQYYGLKKDDVVSIVTTTNNFYISGCVTNEIEKFCKWSRQIGNDTKIILVNHEFGYPYQGLGSLKAYNLPIIEDCAGSFFSEDKDKEIGNIGDFVIYSFPKMFPIQIGGLLVSRKTGQFSIKDRINGMRLKYIKSVLSHYIGSASEIVRKRYNNYAYLKSRFEEFGFSERFNTGTGQIPGVFMFRTDGRKIDLPHLKKYFYEHGVQCSVFYGEEAFFIPVHQALGECDLDYFYEIMRSFINAQNQ